MIGAILLGVVMLASPSPDLEELLRQGVELRRQQQNEAALELFRQAHALEPSARTLAQIALAEQALGSWLEAERDLLLALSSEDDPWIQHNRAALEAARETIAGRLGWLVVTSDVRGAELFLDTTRTATLPLAAPLRAVTGERVLELRHPGYLRTRRTTVIWPGTTTREHVALVPELPETPVQAGLQPAAAVTAPLEAPPAVERDQTLGWVLLAGGGVLLAASAGAFAVRQTNASKWNDDARCLSSSQTREERCGDYRKNAELAEVLMIAGLAAGGLSIGGGAGWLVLGGEF